MTMTCTMNFPCADRLDPRQHGQVHVRAPLFHLDHRNRLPLWPWPGHAHGSHGRVRYCCQAWYSHQGWGSARACSQDQGETCIASAPPHLARAPFPGIRLRWRFVLRICGLNGKTPTRIRPLQIDVRPLCEAVVYAMVYRRRYGCACAKS